MKRRRSTGSPGTPITHPGGSPLLQLDTIGGHIRAKQVAELLKPIS
jgi:hypothetical protein